jgi:hypothetical protein
LSGEDWLSLEFTDDSLEDVLEVWLTVKEAELPVAPDEVALGELCVAAG